jgi:hypothetical protein
VIQTDTVSLAYVSIACAGLLSMFLWGKVAPGANVALIRRLGNDYIFRARCKCGRSFRFSHPWPDIPSRAKCRHCGGDFALSYDQVDLKRLLDEKARAEKTAGRKQAV